MIAVAMKAKRRSVEICAPVLCKALWRKLLHLLGRPQGGRTSNLPSVGMARLHLSLPEFSRSKAAADMCAQAPLGKV